MWGQPPSAVRRAQPGNSAHGLQCLASARPASPTFVPCSRMTATISSASASARRPSSSGTTGVDRSRTARRNDFSSACSGSSEATGTLVTPICGFTVGVPARLLPHRKHQHFLPSVIERNILSRLEESQLAHPLRRNPARGKVRNAPGLKLQPHVRNVHLPRQNRQSDRPHFFDRRLRKRQHDVEIVDHQIQHNIHIQRPRSKHAQPVHLKKHGLRQQRNRGPHRRIEALQMPHLRDPLVRSRKRNQLLGLRQRARQRLLDQHIHASLHQLAGDAQVMQCGTRHRSGLQLAMRGQHLMHRAEGLAPELARYLVRAARVRIDHSQQPHRLPLLLQFLVDSGMVASENAHAHDGDGDRTVRWQEKFSMAGCRKQIVNGIPGKSIWISRSAQAPWTRSYAGMQPVQRDFGVRHGFSSCAQTTNLYRTVEEQPFEGRERDHRKLGSRYSCQPRSGDRMQPTAQAVGQTSRMTPSPGGAKESLPPNTTTTRCFHPRYAHVIDRLNEHRKD